MKNVKRIVGVAIVVAIIAGAAIGSGMIQKTPEAIQKTVIGKVGETDITIAQIQPQMEQLYGMISSQIQGNPMDNPDVKKTIIQAREKAVNTLIEQDIIKQQVTAQKITVTDAEISAEVDKMYNGQINEFIQKAGNDKAKGTAAFNEALKSSPYKDEAGFKAELKKEIEKNYPEQKVINTVIDAVPKVTEAEAQSYYNENKAQFTKEAGADVYQIVTASKEKTEALRTEYLEKTKGMTDVKDKLAVFSKLASENNSDNTKNTGGSLGYVKYSDTQLVPEFMTAVKGLKAAGDISEVVNSKTSTYSAYNFIFVSQVNKDNVVEPFADVNKDDALVNQLYGQKQQQAFTVKLDEWKKAADAEVLTNKLGYAVPVAPKTEEPATK